MTTTATDFGALFGACRTVEDANSLYKRLHASLFMELSEAHRRAMERMSVEVRERQPASQLDSNGPRNHEIRNWAMREGYPLNHNRISKKVREAYAAAQSIPVPLPPDVEELVSDAPVVDSKPPKITLGEIGVTSSEIRSWARSAGIDVNSRGRVHPDIVRQYAEAHS